MKIEDLEVETGTALLHEEIDGVEFILNFGWNFISHVEEGDTKIDVYCEDGVQYINGVPHPYFPNAEEMREIKAKIEDVISEDYFSYGLSEWIEGQRPDRDYYNEY